MTKRPNLGQITTPVFNVSQLNQAFTKIDEAFDNTLSRDGSTPNTLLADLDMNSNDILNAGVLYGTTVNVDEAYIGGKLFTGTLTWRSDWLTSTSYQENDLVKINGNVYVCLDAHSSGVFATDLAASRWELFVENTEGPAGPTGADGPQGPAGQGVPTGGTTGQVLAKINATDYNTQWVTPGGVSDGDKGDITVSGSGATWTIDNGVVSLAKMANMATSSLIYRKTAGTGAPEVNTLATLKTDLGLTGTNSGDQTITLTGAVTGSGTGSFATSLGSFTKSQLNTAVSDGDVLYVGDVTSNATHTGDVTGSTTLTLATVNSNVGSFGSATQIPTFTVNGKGLTTAAANVSIAIPSTQVTDFAEAVDDRVSALLVAGTNVTLTYNDVANTLTVAATGGGGSGDVTAAATFGTDNRLIRSDGTGKGVQASGVDLDDNGVMTLPAASTPSAPSAGVSLFAKNYALTAIPHIRSAGDVSDHALQPMLGDGSYFAVMPSTGNAITYLGYPAGTGQGTATTAALATGSRRGRLKKIEYLVTVAATTAVAEFRINSAQLTINGGNSWEGGFLGLMHGGPSTGVAANSSHRFFMGMADTVAASDVNPSSQTLIAGIGYDSADTNLQFMHNDSTGTATKIDLGASFPKPNADRAFTYRMRLFAPPGTTRSLSYEVTYLETGAVATGTVTTDLPATGSLLAPKIYSSVGGVSAVTGVALGPWTFHTEPF